MENQHTAVVSENTQNVFSQTINFKFETENLSKKELQTAFAQLNFLCLNYDPYQPENMTSELKEIINKFNLESTLSNPFDFTNSVLQYLDSIETQLNLIQ